MPAEQLRNARSGAQIKFSTSGDFNESEVQQNMKIVKCFSRVSFSFHSQLAAAGHCAEDTEELQPEIVCHEGTRVAAGNSHSQCVE